MIISLSLPKAPAYTAPVLTTDVPNKTWLAEEQAYNLSKGKNRHGAPAVFGATTGWWSHPVMLPVSLLKTFRGLSGEQGQVRPDSLEWLKKHLAEQKRLPLTESGNHYLPYLEVWQDGTPWVSEGNHRIMAAAALHYRYLPVQMRYFGGAEQVKSGPLHPDKVLHHDETAFKEGFTLDSYAP